MCKKVSTILISAIILIAAAVYLRPLKAFAGSAAVGLLLEDTDVTVGDTFNVILTVESDVELGIVDCLLYYNESKVKYKVGETNICQGNQENGILVKILDKEVGKSSTKYMMKFIALAPGNADFNIVINSIYDSAGSPISASSIDATLTINAQAEASSDASLKSLRVSPGTLLPTFAPDVFEYYVDVTKDTGSIFVGAIANDEKANVKINGHDKLYPGSNEVHVIVTAENGTILDYKINVFRADETHKPSPTPSPEPVVTDEPLPTEAALPGKISIVEKDGKRYFTGDFSYEIVDDESGIEIPAGFLRTKLMIDGESIIAYAPANGENTDFALIILRTNAGTTALYRYDRVEKTVQRFDPKDITIHDETGQSSITDEVTKTIEEYEQATQKFGLILAGVLVLWMITLLILMYVLRKESK